MRLSHTWVCLLAAAHIAPAQVNPVAQDAYIAVGSGSNFGSQPTIAIGGASQFHVATMPTGWIAAFPIVRL